MSGRVSKKKRILLIVLTVLVLLLLALGVGGWKYHEQPRFCGDLCHIMDPYLESWNGSDYGAAAHAAEGVTCLYCHEPTIQEQVNELIAFVKGDYTVPLEGLEVSDEFCYDCHLLDGHESKEQVVERTAELDRNPHDSHLVGEIGCATCHSMHKPSEEQCALCHDEIATGAGWSEEVTRSDEIEVWEPDMDCTVCKSMVTYVDSLEDPASMGYAHAQEGLTCFDCHDQDALKQVHEEAVPVSRLASLKVENGFCFDCHIDNEHATYEQIVGRTADYVVSATFLGSSDASFETYHEGSVELVTEDRNINPHDPHPDGVSEGFEQFEGPYACDLCHKMHKKSPLIDACYTCHHQRVLDSCPTCHGK